MRSDRSRLQDILGAIDRIEQYTQGGKAIFEGNDLIQSGVLYQLIAIGEAVGDLSLDLREQYPLIPWKKIIGMRNLVAHEYFRVDLEVVWAVVDRELPRLKSQVEQILQLYRRQRAISFCWKRSRSFRGDTIAQSSQYRDTSRISQKGLETFRTTSRISPTT